MSFDFNERREPLSMEDVFGLDSADEAGDIVMEWMQTFGFQGYEIAKVMRNLNPDDFPSLFVEFPGIGDIKLAVETILNEPRVVLQAHGVSTDCVTQYADSFYEGRSDATVDLAKDLNDAFAAAGNGLSVKQGSVLTLQPAVSFGLRDLYGDEMGVDDQHAACRLMRSAYASKSSVRLHVVDDIPPWLPVPEGIARGLDGGLVAIAPNIGIATMAAKMCCVSGRHHPHVAPYIWYVDDRGHWWPPGSVPHAASGGVSPRPRTGRGWEPGGTESIDAAHVRLIRFVKDKLREGVPRDRIHPVVESGA